MRSGRVVIVNGEATVELQSRDDVEKLIKKLDDTKVANRYC